MSLTMIVLSKGSQRVAEVAARFTLDAMLDKQMSIDACLAAAAKVLPSRGGLTTRFRPSGDGGGGRPSGHLAFQ
jgi:hypothetical protein